MDKIMKQTLKWMTKQKSNRMKMIKMDMAMEMKVQLMTTVGVMVMTKRVMVGINMNKLKMTLKQVWEMECRLDKLIQWLKENLKQVQIM